MNYRILFIITFIGLFFFSAQAKKGDEKTNTPKNSIIEQRKLDYFFYEAVKQKNMGNYDASIDLLTECYFINSHNSAVLFEFSNIYNKFQDYDNALKFISLAIKEDKENTWYKKKLAELFIKKNELDNAITVYEDIIKSDPDKNLYVMLASLYSQTNQNEKSIACLNSFEKENGINKNISFEKYRLYKKLNKNTKAYKEIDKLIQKFPLEYDYQIYRAEMYLKEQHKPKKAFQIYTKIQKEDPNNVMLILSLYNYYNFLNDTLKANNVYLEAFKNPEINIDDKIGLLSQQITSENQSVPQTEEYFKVLLSESPENEILNTYYASFLLMQKRFKEAIPPLEAMLKKNPDNKDGWIELIKTYMEINDFDKANTTIDSALIYFPKEGLFYLHKGLALIDKKNFDEALVVFKEGIDSSTENSIIADLSLNIGDIYANQNALDSAFFYYEKSYQINPNNALLLNNYAYYLSLANKDLSKAEIMSAKTIELYPNNISFLDTYAWIFFQKGNLILAYMYIQQAIDKGGDKHPVVIEHFGDIMYVKGEIDEALDFGNYPRRVGTTQKY